MLRVWAALWRQGRGRPVNRGVLEQSGAVSKVFIDEVAHLCDQLRGNGTALVKALHNKQVKGFYSKKIDELKNWLALQGHIDDDSMLNTAERYRLTVEKSAPKSNAAASDINKVVSWLEAALA